MVVVKKVRIVGEVPDIKEIKKGPEHLFVDHMPHHVSLIVSPTGKGRSLKNINEAVDLARNIGKTVYLETVEDSDEVKLINPRVVDTPLSDFEKYIVKKVSGFSAYGDARDLFRNTIEAGSLSRYRRLLDIFSHELAENACLSLIEIEAYPWTTREFNGYPAKLRLSSQEVESARDFFWELDETALQRLSRELETELITSQRVKGILVREDPTTLQEWYGTPKIEKIGGALVQVGPMQRDLDAEFMGKNSREIEATVGQVTEKMVEGLNNLIEKQKPDTVRNRETLLCREHAGELTRYYADKWRRVNEVMEGEWTTGHWRRKSKTRYLQAFKTVKDDIVFHPWVKNYVMEDIGDNAKPVFTEVVDIVNSGIRKDIPTNIIASDLKPLLAGLEDAALEDSRKSGPTKEKMGKLHEAVKILRKRPRLFIKLARTWIEKREQP
jgi:hypothetical protein